LPNFDEQDPGRPAIVVAAGGTAAGWRRAALSLRNGDQLEELGSTAPQASIGQTIAPVPYHSDMLLDSTNILDVRLANSAMTIPPGTGSPFDQTAPMLLIGDELVRYGTAVQLGPLDYRISGLLRGVRATNGNATNHAIGTYVTFLERQSLLIPDLPGVVIGSTLTIEAIGRGDISPVSQSLGVEARALRPLPPVHVRVTREVDGAINIEWIRRSRFDPGWIDYSDIPLGEEALEFELVLSFEGQRLVVQLVEQSATAISAAVVDSWALTPGSEILLEIRQMGKFAASHAATMAFVI
jgi:hypothetical protein